MNKFINAIEEAKSTRKRKLVYIIAGITSLLVSALFFYAYATSFKVHLQPVPEKAYNLSTEAGFSINIGGRVLLPFGSTTIIIQAPGFIEERKIISSKNPEKIVKIQLSYAPVSTSLTSAVELSNPKWIVNGIILSEDQNPILKLKPGEYKIALSSDYHTADEQLVSIKPITSPIIRFDTHLKSVSFTIKTRPTDAKIFIDDELVGNSPWKGILEAGKINLRVEKTGYKSISQAIDTKNEKTIVDRTYSLAKKTRLVNAKSHPPAGRLFINNIYRKITSEISIDATEQSLVRYEAEGHQGETIVVYPDDKKISFKLKPIYGSVEILSSPKSKIFIEGELVGETPMNAKLLAKQHLITLKAPNYIEDSKKIAIEANKKIRHDRKLTTVSDYRLANSQPSVKNSMGIVMNRFIPSKIEIGAPRNQKGQRANEHLRKVDFTRAFYIGKFEITEKQYAIFENENSNSSLAPKGSRLPVRSISWEEAATFCNWLSLKEGFEPFYISRQSRIIGFDKSSLGYRLPTEAEWEYVARAAGKKAPTTFVWGNDYEVPEAAGNIADESAKGTVKIFLGEYNDGFAGIAPSGSFDAEISGLHDQSGNVSEWTHDFYLLDPPEVNKVYFDYMGKPKGASHVIKGSNYLSASWTELRASYKDTSNDGRIDVGFRIARYIN